MYVLAVLSVFIVLICVYKNVKHTCVQVCEPVYAVTRVSTVASSVIFHMVFWDKVEPGSILVAINSHRFSRLYVSMHPMPVFQVCVPPCPVYYMGSGDLNSNPYVCPASILTTEPSPQSPGTFSLFNKNLIIMSYSWNYIISILGKFDVTGISIGFDNHDIFVIFNLYAL